MQRNPPPELVEMGVVGGAYGVRGMIKVVPWSEARAALLEHDSWWIDGVERRVERARVHGAHLVGKLANLETPEAARLLKGKAVCVARSALPQAEPGRYYFTDLVGLEVVNAAGESLGVVERLEAHGAQDVMQVAAASGSRRLLPWVDAVVKRVDLVARRIEVEWEADW